jgi:hypothetical protein
MFLTLLPYLTVAANLALVLGVMLGVGQRVRELRTRAVQQEKEAKAETQRLSQELAELKDRILELEKTPEPAVSSALPAPEAHIGNGLNNTLRSKILKMHRMGQSPDRIAGNLRLPKGEVDLLVKVHKIVMRPYEEVVLAPLGEEAVEKA